MNLAQLTVAHRRILDRLQELDRHASHSDERILALHQLSLDLENSALEICKAIAQERLLRLAEAT